MHRYGVLQARPVLPAAGGTVHRAVQDQFYGDRSGTLTDPFGILWTLATHIEDVTEEEVKRRMASMGAQS